MTTKHINWEEFHEDIIYTCPFCNGEGRILKEFDELNEEDRKKLIQSYCDYLNITTLLDVMVWFVDFDRPALETDFKDFYDDDELRCMYDLYFTKDTCERCTNGNLEPLYNLAYKLEYAEYNNANRKLAAECGLFLFEDDEGVWMSLMSCEMDLTPRIIMAFRLLDEYIPYEWATEWRQNYRANITHESHNLNAVACMKTLEQVLLHTKLRLKTITEYIKPKEAK